MGKWGWKFWGLVCFAIVIVASMTTIAFKHTSLTTSSAPLMPEVKEVKSEPAVKSPILEKAFKSQVAGRQVKLLIKKLKNKGIYIDKTGFIRDTIALAFLQELLADEKSQKIFREFSEAGITIFLTDEYAVLSGSVFINTNDSVKKVAKWLATGKN